jgi:hypothetical protein
VSAHSWLFSATVIITAPSPSKHQQGAGKNEEISGIKKKETKETARQEEKQKRGHVLSLSFG